MKVEGDLPDYPGFEKDVYNTVTGYFQGLKESLLTYSMYEVFTNVFGKNFYLVVILQYLVQFFGVKYWCKTGVQVESPQ